MKHIVRISILLSISFCFQGCGQVSHEQDDGHNGLLRANETQTSDSELGFSMTTTTKNGITVHATAEPNMLTFLMEGNIEPDRWLPMLGLNIHYKELTQEQIEQKEAALRLLEYSGYFVYPRDVKLKTTSRRGTARFRFECEDGTRRIELNAQLKDAKGNSLVTMNRICNCNFGGGTIQHGTLIFDILPGNSEHFDFDRGLAKDVKQISITLKEL